MTVEKQRLIEDRDKVKNWRQWGPYLTDRQWGTVREDYSAHGDAWNYITQKKAGNTLTAEILPVKKGNIKVKPGGELVDKEYVLKSLKSPTAVVVDARMTRFYDGEPTGNPRDGHITGAQNIPYTEMVDANNMFKPMDQLQPYFTPVADKNEEIVAYCFIGQTASVVYMAGRILRYNVKLYDASLQEWSPLDNLPMVSTKK